MAVIAAKVYSNYWSLRFTKFNVAESTVQVMDLGQICQIAFGLGRITILGIWQGTLTIRWRIKSNDLGRITILDIWQGTLTIRWWIKSNGLGRISISDLWQGTLTIRWWIKSNGSKYVDLPKWPVTNQQATLISFQVLPHRRWEVTDRQSDCLHTWIGFN